MPPLETGFGESRFPHLLLPALGTYTKITEITPALESLQCQQNASKTRFYASE